MKELLLEKAVLIKNNLSQKEIFEKGDIIRTDFEELKENRKSDIGYGDAIIFTARDSSYKPASIEYFKDKKEVYVAKDEEDAKEKSLKGVPTVLVTNSYKGIFRAYPVINGELKLSGMAGSSFIYSWNNVVMKGYLHPIRLMDRFE